jgi:hypothetical protein
MATSQKSADKDPKEVKLEAGKVYTIIGTGFSTKGKAFLEKGVEYEVLGADAEVIINSGKATLKA